MSKYILSTGEVAAAGSKTMFDLFNAAGSENKIILKSLLIRTKNDVAVSGVVAPRFDLVRTSAVGTSGTSVPYAPSAVTGAGIILPDPRTSDLPTQITARTGPAGGATTQHYLSTAYPFSEETNAGSYLDQKLILDGVEFIAYPGEGFAVKQGSVASVNSYLFLAVFEVEEL